MLFGILSNLEIIQSIQEDGHWSYANTMPLYRKDSSAHGFWYLRGLWSQYPADRAADSKGQLCCVKVVGEPGSSLPADCLVIFTELDPVAIQLHSRKPSCSNCPSGTCLVHLTQNEVNVTELYNYE